MYHAYAYLDKIQTQTQLLVKHNTLENFSLATDVSVGVLFPRRCTCIAYTDIEIVYLVFLSSLLHFIFRSRSNPWVGTSFFRYCSPNTKSSIKLGYWTVLRLFTHIQIYLTISNLVVYLDSLTFFSLSFIWIKLKSYLKLKFFLLL